VSGSLVLKAGHGDDGIVAGQGTSQVTFHSVSGNENKMRSEILSYGLLYHVVW
jgi:hypothetical protein